MQIVTDTARADSSIFDSRPPALNVVDNSRRPAKSISRENNEAMLRLDWRSNLNLTFYDYFHSLFMYRHNFINSRSFWPWNSFFVRSVFQISRCKTSVFPSLTQQTPHCAVSLPCEMRERPVEKDALYCNNISHRAQLFLFWGCLGEAGTRGCVIQWVLRPNKQYNVRTEDNSTNPKSQKAIYKYFPPFQAEYQLIC